jgi:hypothetical protein
LISSGEQTPSFPLVFRSLSLTLAWTIYRIIYTHELNNKKKTLSRTRPSSSIKKQKKKIR